MKKVFPLILVLTLILLAACGGGDSTDEPTETTSPTPTEMTPTPTTDEPTPTETQEPTSTPTSTVDNSIDSVLAEVSNPILAYARVGGEWEGYLSSEAKTLSVLEKLDAYFVFSSKKTIIEGAGWPELVASGWQLLAWTQNDKSVSALLSGYEDAVLFIVGYNEVSEQYEVYMSSSVKPLTEIPTGQEYCIITGSGGPPSAPVCEIR